MKRHQLRSAAVLVAGAAVLTLTACSDDSGGGTGGDGAGDDPVVLTVGGMPTAEKAEQLAEWDRRVEEFETANPDIDIESEETAFDATTFNALVAGGQLPTVFNVPFTEMRGLIARQQVTDLTDHLESSETLSAINPVVNEIVTDDERVYGIPWGAYTMGLIYNRQLFEQAGLDPDDPPSTWDDVRTAAQAIEAATDAQGFAAMTTQNNGGWSLTTMSYGFGGTIVNEDGTEADVDNPATVEALEFLRTLRWDDNVMGSNFLLNAEDIARLFAGGGAGMYVGGADAYNTMVTNNGMDPAAFGVAPLPQQDDGIGTLSGGTVAIVKPDASEDEIEAAVRWIEFQRFEKYTDEQIAKDNAAASAADGIPVGKPELPVVDRETYDQYLGWIADSINVPRENYTAYLESVDALPLVTEPAVKAQELYALLDTVVQAVLTREDADVEALLSDADASAQTALDAG
ncbi:ABC transporter substrate-binding protein [Jiangella sp. DSM 45060]|uniref:ABC transporter substrate-binding protein n=1 Tax=Jiangella sp. DSM 45060 TaxID=1798224 RepID=UPI00087C7C46|nr:extracellular solute-binding protein [Jiangella sp. DSM 45060]SDS47536.1 ABC-type glycerol-3-phosphate transport system, substrate-binding protein [Jiangella sp. DSM 45060]